MFNILPPAQDFFICLRCQYRLSTRRGPRPGSQRHKRYSPQRRSFAAGTYLWQEPSASYNATANDVIPEKPPIRYMVDELHPYQQEDPSATKGSLGLNVLGQPAEVLILRDRRRRFELEKAMAKVRASGPDRNPPPEPISSSEMLEKIDAERGLIDIDEVLKNIESLRTSVIASTKGPVKNDVYTVLASKLQEGFTKPQLAAYLDRTLKDLPADPFDLDVDIANTAYARSSWQLVKDTLRSEQTPLPSRYPRAPFIVNDLTEGESKGETVLRKGRGGESLKESVVRRILRQCWKMRPRVQESSKGEVDIRLQKRHLQLILKHKRDILKLLATTYDAKVEAWPRAPVIRITSSYDSCLDVMRILVHSVENIQISTVDLDDGLGPKQVPVSLPRKLDDGILQQIEKYTNTLVEPQDASRKALRVYSMGPDDTDFLETQRLIHQILRPAFTSASKISLSKGFETSDVRPVPVMVGTRLSMLDRNRKWSRLCNPRSNDQPGTMKAGEGTQSSGSVVGIAARFGHGKVAFDRVKTLFGTPQETSYEHCVTNVPHWTPEIEYHDSVKFGQVLFPSHLVSTIPTILRNLEGDESGNPVKDIHNKLRRLITVKQPREFVPLVPWLVHTLKTLGSLKKNEELVQIRLSPSPKNWSLPVPFKFLPDLEIRVSLNEKDKTTSIKDVALIKRVEEDFLQPQNTVDLRCIRERSVHAKDGNLDPQILSFVQKSTLNVWSTERLQTPPGLSLSVPALAIQPYDGFDPKKHDSLLVDYASLGLELRSSLSIAYQRTDAWPTLTYTIIEAGRIAGRRDELSLHNFSFTSRPKPTPSSPTDTDPSLSLSPFSSTTLATTDHTLTLFQKTASIIQRIERSSEIDFANVATRPTTRTRTTDTRLRMPKLPRRWRRTRPVRRGVRVRKVDIPDSEKTELGPNQRPYVPRVSKDIRRVVTSDNSPFRHF